MGTTGVSSVASPAPPPPAPGLPARMPARPTPALVRPAALVGQRRLPRVALLARGRPEAVAREALVAQVGGLVGVEVEVDRVHGDDGGEQRRLARPGAAGDEVARPNDGAPDP